VVQGPVNFALISSRGFESTVEELASAIAKLLANEVKYAVEAGASMVQIDEPILADPDASRDDALLAVELANLIAKAAGGAKTVLALYFDVPRPDIYDALLNAKVNCISLDIVDAPGRALKLVESKGFGGHCGVLGLINSRTIYDDPLVELEELASKLAKLSGGDELGITTTTWLDLIPFKYSLKKTRLLGLLTSRLAEKFGWELVEGGEV
jgi:5-methyltetrahydropteroyltriglutamate--homocysteine methyltransferase